MEKISVIVPVYNVENYLNKCIDSIINQSYENLEIILVDDGSTDSSGYICDQYKEKDSRIIVLHKINGGLSDARNCGLEVASGDYIGFVDSDDYINRKFYEVLYEGMKKTESKVAIANICHEFPDKMQRTNYKTAVLKSTKQFFDVCIVGELMMSVCNKLFCKDLLLGKSFKKGKKYEDIYFFPDWVFDVRTACICEGAKYHYIERVGSITQSKFTPSMMDKIDASINLLTSIERNLPEQKIYGEFTLWWSCKSLLEMILLENDLKNKKEEKIIRSYLLKMSFLIVKNPLLSFKQKLATFILLGNKDLYFKLKSRG